MSLKELNKLAKELQKKMHQAAAELNFEEAVVLRDRMLQVKPCCWNWKDRKIKKRLGESGCSNRRKAVGNNADPVIGSSIEIDLIGQLIF